jgi:rhodanese-related sulfurtransferase
VYLAQLGYQVRGVDLSAVGLKKAEELARNQGVTIETQIADLATLEIAPGFWQGIVSIFAHVPSAVRRELHRKVVAGLAPGGVLLLEAYTVRQWETGGVGGPNREQRDLFMSLEELSHRIGGNSADMVILDIREKDAFDAGHVPGARHLPRGQLELRVNAELPDPTVRILTCCEFGKISTLAAATLRDMGFTRAVALDGGMQAWRENGYPTES